MQLKKKRVWTWYHMRGREILRVDVKSQVWLWDRSQMWILDRRCGLKLYVWMWNIVSRRKIICVIENHTCGREKLCVKFRSRLCRRVITFVCIWNLMCGCEIKFMDVRSHVRTWKLICRREIVYVDARSHMWMWDHILCV